MSDNEPLEGDAVILYPETPDDRTCLVHHDVTSDTYVLYRSESDERASMEQTLQRLAEKLDEILHEE